MIKSQTAYLNHLFDIEQTLLFGVSFFFSMKGNVF